MDESYLLPNWTAAMAPSEYAWALRDKVFSSTREAAGELPISHASIADYEKESGTTPPLGYLACLATALIEKQSKKGLSDAELGRLRTSLVEQLKKLVLGPFRRDHYQGVTPPSNWAEVKAAADAWVAKQRQLRRDTGTAGKEPPPGPSGPSIVPPLPPQGVIGRDDYLAQISTMLALDDPQATEVPPLALRGWGGVGKSTLAIATGRSPQVIKSFPQGILWTELGPKPTIRLILNTWGRVLGVDLLPERDEQACALRLREVLFHRRVLLIVDDVWELDHSTHFLVGGPHCRTLFTTREAPIAHALAMRDRTLRVDVLKLPDALEMLGKFVPQLIATEREAAQKLCERLECLPLALKLAGRLLANEADVPSRMRRVLDELIERREVRLGLILDEGDPRLEDLTEVSLKAILGMSVERLSVEEQDRFAMLSEFGGEPLTWEIKAASAVWDCSVEDAEKTTAHFIHRGLVEQRNDGRYWMHALLADYAGELMVERDL